MSSNKGLVTGVALDSVKFFSAGNPDVKGSSFDLTIGDIIDDRGKKVKGHYTLKPGHMVQVISAEVFNLPPTVTGHVTYKTTMTKKGIWALTIGIVDPGWDGPITTSLLNFSKVPFVLWPGAPFLRVSFFEHDEIPKELIRKMGTIERYERDVQQAAIKTFPPTFMDKDDISEGAGNHALARLRKEFLIWIAVLGFLFAGIQWFLNTPYRSATLEASQEFGRVRTRVEDLQSRVTMLEALAINSSPTSKEVKKTDKRSP